MHTHTHTYTQLMKTVKCYMHVHAGACERPGEMKTRGKKTKVNKNLSIDSIGKQKKH